MMVTVLGMLLLGTAVPVNAGGAAVSTGSGSYLLLGTAPTAFEYNAIAGPGGAGGQVAVSTIVQGFVVDFEGDVTCVSHDPVNHRAWIGGVITANRSTHPSYTTPRTQVGHDIWFRVVDYGEGAGQPADRTSFVGFEGDLEIPTSAAYCEQQPWAADDARTWAVTDGNIQVHD
jgi:hypothetical protein